MGYAAFDDSMPGNLLTGFGFYNPFWLLDIANAAMVIHLLGAYQVFLSSALCLHREMGEWGMAQLHVYL
ncbi:hypothetical protein M5K25_001191 [Dendrobium thyrsiflorum]|uniref:Amino acid transporter transmembrane domain-containing protein n=1 Tax=Dendrobium thyrsiflorum TaxID=117978 RepID=A0ABD0VQT2_DENTH